VDYSHGLIVEQALQFIEHNQDDPFFLYVPLTIPHANNEGTRATGNGQEVPEYGIYADKSWTEPDKGQAAMITRMDHDLGRLLIKLKELGIDGRTVVMFSSDNGHHDEGGHNTDLFDPNGPLRGKKRDLYEGGLRVPMIVRWPGETPAATGTDHISYFGDLMATVCELGGVMPPANVDSISFLATITGNSPQQLKHEYLYWEFYERGGKQALRQEQWKAVRMPLFTGKTELFDLSQDLGEAHDIADQHPEIVKQLEEKMASAHVPHPNWIPRGQIERNQPTPGDGQPRF